LNQHPAGEAAAGAYSVADGLGRKGAAAGHIPQPFNAGSGGNLGRVRLHMLEPIAHPARSLADMIFRLPVKLARGHNPRVYLLK
jgi:hypothetical protein